MLAPAVDVGNQSNRRLSRVKAIKLTQGGVISKELSIPAGTSINFGNHPVTYTGNTYQAMTVKGNNVSITGLNINAGGHRAITASV